MDTVQVAESDANNNALLNLLQTTLSEAEKHENYIKAHQSMFNLTTKRLVGNIRNNLQQAIELCIKERYEPVRVILSTVQSEIEIERQFYLKRDAEQIQKITRLEVHIEKLNTEIQRLTKENSTMQAEIVNMRDTNTKLRDELTEMRDTNKKLGFELMEMRDTNTKLGSELTKMENTNKKLESELTKMEDNNTKLGDELTKLQHNAARRQIALNIEHEIKKELFVALGWKATRSSLHNTTIFRLRSKFCKQSLQMPKVLNGILDLNGEDEWTRFDDLMYHLKEFSRDGAHPTDLGREPITERKALELIEEPFMTIVPDDCTPWENLKDQAREMVQSLQKYRLPGEKFIKSF